MSTKNGLVTLVISEADYYEISAVLETKKAEIKMSNTASAVNRSVVARILDNIREQHKTQMR